MSINTAKHTPGPWFAVNDGHEIHDKATQYDEHGARIGSTPNMIASVEFCPNPISQDGHATRMANARLMAASPKLLAAAKSVLALVDRDEGVDGEDLDRISRILRKAIAEAEGGAA